MKIGLIILIILSSCSHKRLTESVYNNPWSNMTAKDRDAIYDSEHLRPDSIGRARIAKIIKERFQ